MKAAMASEATKMAVRSNLYIDTRVVEVMEFNSEVRCDLQGRFEAAMASEAIKITVRGNMLIDARVIKVAGFKSEIKLDLWTIEATRI